MRFHNIVILTLCLIIFAALPSSAAVFGISKDGSYFTINSKPVFMYGISYYGAMTISSPAFITADLDDMKKDGINWIRVWAYWDPGDLNVSVTDRDGNIRQPYMNRLRRLINECNKRGMIVDVTFGRGNEPFPGNQQQHLACVKTITKTLKPYRNVYFDMANERDVRDARYINYDEMGELISAVKAIDPKRLCTASGVPSSANDLERYIKTGKCDFIAPHLGRSKESPAQTESTVKEFIQWMEEKSSPRVPVMLQEPFRRDYAPYNPEADDYFTDIIGGKRGGAAGWCLHNGSSEGDDGIFRSFRMTDRDGRLYDQLDEVELEVVHNALKKIKSIKASGD